MPLQGLMLFLFMIITIPILIIFANQNVFFILISAILFYTSLRNIYKKVFPFKNPPTEPEDDVSEEFEQTMNVNVKKFKDGISVSKDLIIMLFFIYCTFIVSNFLINIIIALILTFRLSNVFNSINTKEIVKNHFLIARLKAVLPIFIDILTTIIIILISMEKYFNFIV